MHISLVLTLSRLILSPLLLAPLIALRAPASVTLAVYIFIALTDFFDGYFARAYNQVSPLGAFLDQFADKIFLFCVMFATVYTRQLPLTGALLLACRELGVMGMREYGMQKNIALPVMYGAKLKTAFQMILFAWIIGIGLACQDLATYGYDYITIGLFSITIWLSYYSAYVYLRKFVA